MKEILVRIFFFFYRPILGLLYLIDTAIFGTSVILLSFLDRRGNICQYFGKFWGRLNLFLAGVSASVSGQEHIRKGQSYIIMSNHQSALDILALYGYLPLQFRWVMKIELRKYPIFGLGCERMGHIYIDRGDSEKSHESLKAAGSKIRNGTSVLFFPEGTRSRDGKLLPFKKGGFVIALEAGVPILPVTISGSLPLFPKKSLKIIPGNMKMRFHEPILMDGYTYETKEGLMEKVRNVIERDL
jgi:1-acyl-sn-glycerol-3-phosphate acyltransferase